MKTKLQKAMCLKFQCSFFYNPLKNTFKKKVSWLVMCCDISLQSTEIPNKFRMLDFYYFQK